MLNLLSREVTRQFTLSERTYSYVNDPRLRIKNNKVFSLNYSKTYSKDLSFFSVGELVIFDLMPAILEFHPLAFSAALFNQNFSRLLGLPVSFDLFFLLLFLDLPPYLCFSGRSSKLSNRSS